jgi:D-xylose transport system substrate-binding protein
MNNLKGHLTFAALVLAIFLASASPVNAAKSGKDIRIGVSLPTQREEHWVRDAEKMKAVARANGATILLQVCDNDASRQMSQCENLLVKGIDILVLAPHDSTSAAAIVEKAHQAGVKVISYDRLVLDAGADLYMSVDNAEVGRLMGRYLVEKVPKGNYILFGGAPTDNCAILVNRGAKEIIEPLVKKGDIKVVMDQWITDWQPTIAMNLTDNALTANNNRIDAVLAPNDNTAGGIIQALSRVGLAGKVPVTGQDAEVTAARRIVQGAQSMTVFKDSEKVAEETVKTAIRMVKGDKIESNAELNDGMFNVPAVLFKPTAVDRENIDAVLIDTGFLKREDVYGK